MRPFFAIPEYHDFLSPAFARHLLEASCEVPGVAGLRQIGEGGGLETKEALEFLVALYESLEPSLARVLRQRRLDRKFIDERTRACATFNQELGRDLLDPDYQTVIGLEDAQGRIVIGPNSPAYCRAGGKPVAPLPPFLQGPHVTLFGPPDTAKMAINAMNAYHRKLPDEPKIVEELLAGATSVPPTVPMWGADDEDSKTPLRQDFVEAAVNLTGCFEGTLSLTEGAKTYALANDHLSQPIKRVPGLALPSSFLFYRESPIPLHLYDFALHLFRNATNPKALVFYVPKLENEEEAAYIHEMIAQAEELTRARHPAYVPGTIRLMIVLENPRAIVRAHEIMDALDPYFAGASLGWHDYLGSTARLFKEDPNYRIPVKADPNIVIKYIQASHRLLADVVGSRGGIKVGGMYGILPTPGHRESLQIALRGFIKDVVTQLKRDLSGFWIAHPDFMRLGLAFVEAWKRRQSGDPEPLRELVRGLLDEKHQREILAFIDKPDLEGLDRDDPAYVRSLMVADIEESDFIPNNHPDEIRYNVFQSLQYLTDWLCGNGCVALPTVIDGVPVRVMDDLATAERSRWEVWHELRNGRFGLADFVQIAHEEMNFIRRDLSNETKIVQVKWNERTAKWYPIAFRIMLKLMTDPEPVEFATELLLPFTHEPVREAADPWQAMQRIDPAKYRLERYASDLDRYFEICGSERFAREMAMSVLPDLELAERIVRGFTPDEVRTAASFHGDIGQSRASLDARGASEQSKAFAADEAVLAELRSLGAEYRSRFGFKFLISAQGKSADEMLSQLKQRIGNTPEQELGNARAALWEITRKRLGRPELLERLEKLRQKYQVAGVSLAVSRGGHTQTIALGEAKRGGHALSPETELQLASLSKPIASAFAIDYFRAHGIPLDSRVNELLARTSSSFRLRSEGDTAWADQVRLTDLLSHSALNLHYVVGVPAESGIPNAADRLHEVRVISAPGSTFKYSGGGFLVLEHLIEALEGKPVSELTRPFLEKLGTKHLSFSAAAAKDDHAHGYLDTGEEVPGGHLNFPAFAAGARGTPRDLARFLEHLTTAYRDLGGSGGISHDTAVQMLQGTDRGCREFMGCRMGLGIFTAEAGPNRLAIHQGANEGFRALFIHVYDGPDLGKGFVIQCNGDNRAVLLIGELARELLRELEIGGIDHAKLARGFEATGIAQEQIVNLGYKALIFDAFEEDLPEGIVDRGPLDPLASFNLATQARIEKVTNQKFARAENLISPHLPAFDPELFGRQGKIMDSWETARHNPYGSDSLELVLPSRSKIRYVSLSTRFHDGNHPEFVRLEALGESGWSELLPKTALAGHSLLRIDLGETPAEYSRVRVEIFPDGGLSRLGLFAELPATEAKRFDPLAQARPTRLTDPIPKTLKPLAIPYRPSPEEIERNRKHARAIDWASQAFGASVVRASNEHYGPAAQVISPFPPIHMFDGLESARSRKSGHSEEVQIRLGQPTRIERVLLDFTYFVNNNPLEVSVHGLAEGEWLELVSRTNVKAYAGNRREFAIARPEEVDELLVRTYPDGGINRIRVSGPAP